MDDRELRILDFYKILNQLADEASTNLGKELSLNLTPQTDIQVVKQLQAETDEAVQIIRLNMDIPLGGIVDIRKSVKHCTIGGTIPPIECLDIANTIYGGRRTKHFFEKLEEDLPLLKQFAIEIEPLKQLELEIKNCIDDQGNVIDRASEKLRGIRSSIRSLEEKIREKLTFYTRTKSNMLSDTIITIRNERYVLPVKHEHRSTFGGIVHDQSSSGQTLFMEPKAIVELNNELQSKFQEEKHEIQRILQTLSEQIAQYSTSLYNNLSILAQLDFIFARAKLAQRMNATMPKLNNKGFIKMKQARHPLLDQDKVVANDVEIGNTYQAIVITGPNTGGKTVTLKMIGLSTLMAQAGLQIPAQDGCELAVFDHVCADIGDEQSIEQNLSTFSSHLKNIVSIIKKINHNSLVLFDELGAGTDPQEGAALSMAILDKALKKGATVIATTHYPELKAYGYNRDRVINASMEFDVETLQPTYRLLIGIPGRSNAFEIARRLGLHDAIIDQAKGYMGIDTKNVENMIGALEKSKRKSDQEYEEAHSILVEAEKLKTDLEAEWNAFIEKREMLYKKAEEKAEKALQKAKEEAETIVNNLRKKQSEMYLKEHEWIKARKSLEDAHVKLTTDEKNIISNEEKSSFQVQVGDEVQVNSFHQPGVIVDRLNKDEFLVQIGMMKVKIKKNDLKPIKKSTKVEQKHIPIVKQTSEVKTELDVRGERYEEALSKVEHYIDQAVLSGLHRVTIIHGIGTGVLRKGIQQFIKNHPQVSNYRTGSSNEGGSGVTVIELK